MAKKPFLTIDQELRARAYREGYAAGADLKRDRRRARLEHLTHADWIAGYRKGRADAELAAGAYAIEIAFEAARAEAG